MPLHSPVTPLWARRVLLVALLWYPAIGLDYLPFGNSGRYLTVLAGPLSILFLIVWHHQDWRGLVADAWDWLTPFLPLLLAYIAILLWHHIPKPEADLVKRILWAGVIYLAAKRVGVPRIALCWATALGAFAYLVAALWDVLYLQLPRANGGSNAIHFAMSAMWLAGLCLLEALEREDVPLATRLVWAGAGLGALAACVLSGTRGVLIALVPLYLLSAWVAHGRSRLVLRVSAAVPLVAVVAAMVFYDPFEGRLLDAWQEVDRYYNEPTFTFTPVGGRLEIWHIGWVALREHPIVGAGFTTFADLMKAMPSLGRIDPRILAQPHFHNDWVQSAALGGCVLLCGHLLTLVLLARRARHDTARLWLLGAAVAFGLTDLIVHRKVMLSFFVAAWALYAVAGRGDEHKADPLPG